MKVTLITNQIHPPATMLDQCPVCGDPVTRRCIERSHTRKCEYCGQNFTPVATEYAPSPENCPFCKNPTGQSNEYTYNNPADEILPSEHQTLSLNELVKKYGEIHHRYHGPEPGEDQPPDNPEVGERGWGFWWSWTDGNIHSGFGTVVHIERDLDGVVQAYWVDPGEGWEGKVVEAEERARANGFWEEPGCMILDTDCV